MGISIWQVLILLLIVVLLFGTKKLRSLGGDLGSAVKGFKKEMGDDKPADDRQRLDEQDADFDKTQSREKQDSKND